MIIREWSLSWIFEARCLVLDLLFLKARQANIPVKCRDEVDEMTKFDVERAAGICSVDEDTN